MVKLDEDDEIFVILLWDFKLLKSIILHYKVESCSSLRPDPVILRSSEQLKIVELIKTSDVKVILVAKTKS